MTAHVPFPGPAVMALAACLAWPAAGQTAEPLRLTREEAVREALAKNPGLVASQEQVEQARAQVVVAGAFPDPGVSADLMGEPRPFDPSSHIESDQGVQVTVPFPGKIGKRKAVARAAVRAAELSLTQLRQQVASQAAQAYDALLVALRHRDDLGKSREYAADFLRKTEARFQAGTAPRLDVVKAKVDLAQAENDLIANERAIDSARASLNRILGRLGGAPLEPTGALELPAPLPDVATLEKAAASSRPELTSLAAQLEGARVATRLAKQYWAPDLTLGFARNGIAGLPTSYTNSVSFSVPLLFWQHEKGEVAAARHRESELSADIADMRAQVSLDVHGAFASASTARRQALFIRDQLLPEAEEVYRIAATSYGLGGSSALDLIDAKRTLVDAQRQYADALGAAADAEAALELAIGGPIPRPNTGDRS